MTVSIDLELSAGDVQTEITAIKGELEALEDRFDLDSLDLDDLGDTLDDLTDSLDELSDSLGKDLNEAADKLDNLDFEDLNVGGVGSGDGDSGGGTGSDSGDFDPLDFYTADRPGATFDDDEALRRAKNSDFHVGFGDVVKDVVAQHKADGLLPDGTKPDPDLVDIPGDGTIHNRMKGLSNPIKRAIPSMQAWWNLIAAAIPALGAMAVQAGGVAAAMGGVAAAGASIIGLGLIGHGDSMAESMNNAKQEISDLGEALFETFQPTAQTFAPVQAEFFDVVPERLDPVAKSMEDLTVYEDTLFSLFYGMSNWAADAFQVIANNEPILSQLTKRFGGLVGTNILDFFRWITEEAYQNQNALITLGSMFKTFALTLYNVFKAASTFLVVLSPLFGMLKGLSDLLNNSLIFGLLAAATVFGGVAYGAITTAKSISALAMALSSGLIPGLTSAFGMLQAYAFNALMATSATYTFAQSIATLISVATLLTGIGLASWAGYQAYQGMKQVNEIKNQMDGAGGAPPSALGTAGSGGSQTIINEGDKYDVNVNGDTDTATTEKITDTIKLSNESDSARNLNMSSTSSSGGTKGRDSK